MERVVLSTASFCLWDIAPSEKLEICKSLSFKEIQIALSSEKMVCAFLEYLKLQPRPFPFESIAIHAPWCGVRYGNNAKTARILENLQAIQQLIPLETVVFRVNHIVCIEEIINSGLPISIENSDAEGAWAQLKTVGNLTNVPLVLNLNRAVRNEDYLKEMLELFGHRISRIMVSGYDRVNGRMPILATNQLNLLDRVKNLSVPYVLEGLFKPNDMNAIINEREAIISYLNQKTA